MIGNLGREVLDTKAHNVKFYLYQLSEIYVRLFTLLYTFRYRFQFLISQKVDKIRPPDQHVSDQQHEKEKRKRRNLKWRRGKRSNAKSALKLQNLIQFWRI